MRKVPFFSIWLCVAVALSSFTGFAAVEYAPEEPVTAKAYYLYNVDTGAVIAESNSDKLMYPASLTKIMTCILALENTEDIEREPVVFPKYVEEYLYLYQMQHGAISLGGLRAGEEMSMKNMLHALMLPSANEAAMIIADHIAGSQEAFADMMNKRAKELGATSTHFVNANGLFDENHTTTAADMAKIAMHATALPHFMEIVSEYVYDSGPTNLHENLHWESTNQMIIPENEYYYPGLKGIKTGTLPEAGRCFASMATRNGYTYLLVVMGSDYLDEEGNPVPGNSAFRDTQILYDWVFDSFKVKILVEKNKPVAEIPLRLSMDQDFVKLMTADRFSSLVYYNVEASSVAIIPEIPDYIEAPVRKYDKIGEASLMLSGTEIGRVDLLSADTVEASKMLVLWEQIKSITRSFWFKFTVIFVPLLITAYIIMMISRNRRRRERSYKPRRRL